MKRSMISWALGALSAPLAGAEAIDKAQYTLFNPTPTALLREMSTDRPDKTESPYTLDAGHFQIESDLAIFAHDHDTSAGANLNGESWSFGTLNLKVGLFNSTDFQVILAPYSRVRTADRLAGTVGHQSGFGDVLTRVKVNLWGNDGGATAGAVMPFVKWPTSQNQLGNRAIEGGLIFPVAFELPAGFSLGSMTEFDWIQDASSNNYHPEFVNTITISRQIAGELEGFVEFYSLVSAERRAPWIGTVDFGFVYGLTKNIQLDAGLYIGVTRAAADWTPFIGCSVRF
jgi:hypothetical protein